MIGIVKTEAYETAAREAANMENDEMSRKFYFQGDMMLERVADAEHVSTDKFVPIDDDGAVVIGRGEVTGHRHAFYGGAMMFRDSEGAGTVPADLYVGHVVVAPEGAVLKHEEHDAIPLDGGTYRVTRQREADPHAMDEDEEKTVLVND